MIVVLVPVPAIAPGLIVQVPVEGRPLNDTLPVGAAHEGGWIIVPVIGNGNCAMRVTVVSADTQPAAFLAVTEYTPGPNSANTPVVFV